MKLDSLKLLMGRKKVNVKNLDVLSYSLTAGESTQEYLPCLDLAIQKQVSFISTPHFADLAEFDLSPNLIINNNNNNNRDGVICQL